MSVMSEYDDSIIPMELGWQPYFDGNYYQPQNEGIVHARRQNIKNALLYENVGGLTLKQFQEYTELDWLQPHGQFKTVLKQEEHLMGEYKELAHTRGAHQIASLWERTEKLLDSDTNEVISELGDVLWFLNSLSTNAGVDVDSAWKRQMKHIADTSHNATTPIRQIDSMISFGYRPRLMSIEYEGDFVGEMFFVSAYTSLNTKLAYEYHNEGHIDGMKVRQQAVGMWVAGGIGLIASHAHVIGASLADVAATNIQKISLRAERHTLSDKEKRSAEEL